MVIILPLDIDEPARAHPHAIIVTWCWLALAASIFLVDRLVALDLSYGFNQMPDLMISAVTYVVASWSCYADKELFSPLQLWSYMLVQPVWWQALIDLALLVVVARTIERALGSLALCVLTLTLGAMAATLYMLIAIGPVLVGGRGVLLALCGVLLARQPLAQVRMGLGYWFVVMVGWRMIGTIPLLSLTAVAILGCSC